MVKKSGVSPNTPSIPPSGATPPRSLSGSTARQLLEELANGTVPHKTWKDADQILGGVIGTRIRQLEDEGLARPIALSIAISEFQGDPRLREDPEMERYLAHWDRIREA